MDALARRREEWLVGLHLFLSSRLRTTPFAIAARVHPHMAVPSMVPHTQYLLDGVVCALHDYPAWVAAAWVTAVNHLTDVAERYGALRQQLSSLQTAAATAAEATVTTTPKQLGTSTRVPSRRELIYQAHAGVQDLYLAFCVIDVFLKLDTVGANNDSNSKSSSNDHRECDIRVRASRELPQLVSQYFPIFASQSSVILNDAVEEYRVLFLDLLRSWTLSSRSGLSGHPRHDEVAVAEPEMHRRLEEHIRFKQRTARTAENHTRASASSAHALQHALTAWMSRTIAARSGAGNVTRASYAPSASFASRPGANKDDTSHAPSLPLSLASMSLSHSPAPRPSSSATLALPPSFPVSDVPMRSIRTCEQAERWIRSFLHSIFPTRRIHAGNAARCTHCGAAYKTEKARNAHYRSHFRNHNYVRPEEKVVRLTYPSADAFVRHVGDVRKDGYYVAVTEVLERAYKGGAKGAVTVRTRAEVPTSLPTNTTH